ncbi:helix-turn-helix domain-containing protein [Bacillus sp. REN3]|uniref:winged helix-turn-helix transcriptional regulator n=1 Tax=Bacillus sp. REN3 TaxID=2802440 RepID=UPI001FEF0DFD|nr:helix-turn-helix domain-containing protein [Bacillus sp. REN3]
MYQLCPKFESAMQILSKRWTGLIIHKLLTGKHRFSEIEASLPVSGRLLSERLKDLEKAGIVRREVFSEVPIRVEYSLTEKGMALKPVLQSVEQWAQDWVTVEETK